MGEHRWIKDIDAGVDRVAEDLAPSRLLQKALDPPLVIDHHDAEIQRVLHALECDGDHRAPLLVKGDDVTEIEVGERVAADDDEGVVTETILGELDAAGGPSRRQLDGVVELHADGRAIAEVVTDGFWHEHEGDDRLAETVGGEEFHDVLHARFAAQRDHRLGLVACERPRTGALAACHDDCSHGLTSVPCSAETMGASAPLWYQRADAASAAGRRSRGLC